MKKPDYYLVCFELSQKNQIKLGTNKSYANIITGVKKFQISHIYNKHSYKIKNTPLLLLFQTEITQVMCPPNNEYITHGGKWAILFIQY